MKWELNFISEEDFYKHVEGTIRKYEQTAEAKNLKTFNKNIIDPIKITFDSNVYGKSVEDIIDDEVLRQREKTNGTAIGYFHQNIFKYVKKCVVPASVWDVIFEDKIFVEMKNKHNTMNSSSAAKTYSKMLNKINDNPDAICFLVEVIARKSQNVVWELSIDGQKMKNERIRRISIDQFYELVTKDSLAFSKICKILPEIIKEIILKLPNPPKPKDTVLEELRKIDDDLVEVLYSLVFSTYKGFDNK